LSNPPARQFFWWYGIMISETELEVRILQRRLKTHFNNWDFLTTHAWYLEYKEQQKLPVPENLDQMLLLAFQRMPEHAPHITLDEKWRLLITLGKLATANPVIANRDLFDTDNNWQTSVLKIYALIVEKNLANIHSDLGQIKHLRNQNQPRPAKAPLLYLSKKQVAVKDEEDEQCCNWLLRDFTAPLF